MSKKYIAHGGIHLNSTIATQNSLDSILAAYAAGFDFVELDIRLTKDNIPVALHDNSLNATYRMKCDNGEISEMRAVNDYTLEELRNTYIGKADDTLNRACIPTLYECLTLSKKLGIIPMIHPKEYYPSALNAILDICDNVMGKNGYYIVSENAACDVVLSRDFEALCMVIVTDKTEIEHYAKYPNVIMAIRRRNDYDMLVRYAHEKVHLVETTLNDDPRIPCAADVINYDCLSPGKFEKYSNVTERIIKNEKLTLGEKVVFDGYEYMSFGTVCVSFKLMGYAEIEICKHKFTLSSKTWQEYRIPILIYNTTPYVTLYLGTCSEITDILIKTGSHNIKCYVSKTQERDNRE